MPNVVELLPVIIPIAKDVAEDVSTGAEHLVVEGLEGALLFAENTVNATFTVLEDYHNITNTANVEPHTNVEPHNEL